MRSSGEDERRGIPPDLLQLWEEEEAAVKAKHGETAAPEPKERLFNDLLWDHQWYMVSWSKCTGYPSGQIKGCVDYMEVSLAAGMIL